MAIESAVMLRRVVRIACLVLMIGVVLGGAASAQLPITFTPGNPPPVTVGSAMPFNHGTTGQWIQIYSMKVDPLHGNILFLDSAASNLYQLAPNAATPNLVVGPAPSTGSSDCSDLEKAGSYWNAAIAFDKWDNLYVTDRYGSVVQFCRAPYNAAAGTWAFSSTGAQWKSPKYQDPKTGTQVAIAPQDLQVADDGVTFYVSTSNTQDIYKFTVDETGAWSNVTPVITKLQDMVNSMAVDHAGNLFFIENSYDSPSARVNGIRMIAAGSAPIVGNGDGVKEGALPRIDQGFNGINGISFDKQGNLYMSVTNNSSYGGQVDGIFMIPNEGTPTAPNLVWDDTIEIAPVSAGFPSLVDSRGFLWVALGYYNNWAPPGVNAPSCDATTPKTAGNTCVESTIMLWKPGALDLGASAVGGPAPIKITEYSVDGSGSTITLSAPNSFNENDVVKISAPAGDALAPLDGQSFYVSGVGLTSATFQISSGVLTAGASGSTSATATINQAQALYFMFNKKDGDTTVSKFALTAPSGANFKRLDTPPMPNKTASNPATVCTDGATYPRWSANQTTTSSYAFCMYYVELNTTMAGPIQGEVQLLDSTNNVITGSNAYISGVGQGAAVSVVSSAAIQPIASGLNDPRQVAADLWGNTYVADHALKAIEKFPAGTTSATQGRVLGSGLTGPTGVAVDGVGNLYIGDSGKVIEIPFINGALVASQQTTIATGLGTGNLSLAVDGLGNVFVADRQKVQVVEIPNPQTTLMLAGNSFPVLAASAGFKDPTAIATDSSGNVWVADKGNLWEIGTPYGDATEVITGGLDAPVTGLAVDPSGSVFVAGSKGLVWIPFNTATGALNINSKILISGGLGTGSPAIPFGLALDGSQNLYATYGSGSTAGLAQLGIGGAYDFNGYGEINPNVPFEVDAQILNLGNSPLMLTDISTDAVTGANAANFSLAPATLNSPQCGPTTITPPGGSCYLGMILQAPTPGDNSAAVTVMSNAANAVAGVNIAMAGKVVQDFRPATQVTIAPISDVTYPGKETITVTVTASDSTAGIPTGNVILSVGSANGNQPKQTVPVDATGKATFTYSDLMGGSYNVNANFAGDGTAGDTQNTCTPAGTACFAGSAAKTTFKVNPAKPDYLVGPPVSNQTCITWSGNDSNGNSCAPNPKVVTSWAGNTYVQVGNAVWILASVTSKEVGKPTGTITFLQNGKPVDPGQGVNGAIALNGNGVATFSLQNLPRGVYNLTAVYSGDVNYSTQTFQLPKFYVIIPSVQVTQATAGTVSITAGTPVQVTLSLMPLVGFSGDVALECNTADAPVALGDTTTRLPNYTQCTFAYANTVRGTSPVGSSGPVASNIVLTISTNVPVNGGTSSSAVKRGMNWSYAGLLGFGLLGLIAARKRASRFLALICLGLVMGSALMGITACTNAGYSTPPPAPKVKTPAGSYNVQIIGYDANGLKQTSLSDPVFTLPVTVQ